MYWADRKVDEIEKGLKDSLASGKEVVIRDEKTASGRVHVGSMRGVAIHAILERIMQERGHNAKFYYEINDTDPMDGLPSYLDAAEWEQHMGKQLKSIPSPDGKAANFAEYFGQEFIDVIEVSGFHPVFYRASELYDSGRMNDVITIALQNPDKIRSIYKEVSGSIKDADWLPVNVVCEQCGKIGTTKAISFDGNEVEYVCQENAVEWAKGCGHTGKVSPYDGNGALPWKVEWAAKWKVMNVEVEAAGKDHMTKGGSHDTSRRISEEVFEYKTPFAFSYEFFLVGGAKMSSSKGNASTSKEVADLVPRQIFRLAHLGKDVKQAFNFDPDGDTIPLLYDQYDRIAGMYWAGKEDDNARVFALIHADPEDKELLTERFLPRFSQIAFLVQMPHLNLEEEAAAMKGSALTEADLHELNERAEYARLWLQKHAAPAYRFELQETLPSSVAALTDEQKAALKLFGNKVSAVSQYDGQAIHSLLHEVKEESGLEPKEFFSALYTAFLDKDSGPKAGWFLSTLPQDFVVARMSEV